MNNLKRWISGFLAFCLCLCLIPVRAEAHSTITDPGAAKGSNYSTVYASKLDDIFKGKAKLFSNSSDTYALGQSMNMDAEYSVAGKISGWQCYIYANAVYYYLFGDIPFHGEGISGYWKNSRTVLTNQTTVSYSAFMNAGVGFGAYIRTTSNSDGSYNGEYGHSMIVLTYDDSSITYLEGNADGRGLVRITNKTWNEFNSAQLSGKGRRISHVVQYNSTGTVPYVDIGENFYAYLIVNNGWKHLEATDQNVQIAESGNDSDDPKQIWHFIRQSDGSYKIINEFTGFCMDADNYGTDNGTNVGVWNDNGGANQRWYVFGSPMNYSIGVSYRPSLVLDVADGVIENGQNVQLYQSNGSAAQLFNIYKLSQDNVSYSKPSKPAASNVTAVSSSGGKTTVTWSKSPASGSYDSRIYDLRIWKGSSASDFDNPYIKALGLTSTSYTATLPDGTYTMIIAACNTKYHEYYTFGDYYTVTIQTPVSMTVSFNPNGGSVSTASKTVQQGSTYGTLPTPTRSNYSFDGWYTAASGGSKVTSATKVTATSDHTLYAHWTRNSTELSVNTSNSAVISTGGEIKYYTFTPSVSGKYVIYSTGSEDTRVYLYDASGTELDSDDDDGDGNNFRLEYSLTAGTTYTYAVKYYNSSKTGTIPFKFGNVFLVTYNANGGSGAPSAQSKDYGASITLSSTVPTKTGYTFLGWATSSSATTASYQPGESFTANAHTTLYAVWKANTCTISYNANGGSGAPASQVVDLGGTVTLSSVIPSRFGYNFAGWAASATASEAAYQPGDRYTASSNATLYAVWTAAPTIHSELTNGRITYSNVGRYYKVTATESTSYAFSGWGFTYTDDLPWKITLYAANGSKLNSVQGTGAFDQYLSQNLTAGQTYYLYFEITDGTANADFTIHCTSGHSYTSKVTAPTCTERGYTTYTCSYCGHSYISDYVDALGHSYHYTVKTKPTVSASGTLTGTCSRCSGTTTVTLPKLTTTDYNYKVVTAATCTTNGTGRYTWKTTTYGTFYFDVAITKTGHNYTATVTAPTCTERGYTTYTCSRCDDSYVGDYADPLNHNYRYDSKIDPTCTEDGCELYICGRCGATKEKQLSATGHSFGGDGVCDNCGYKVPGEGERENILELPGEDFAGLDTVWIEGLPYPVQGEGDDRYVVLPDEEECYMVTYTYHMGDANDVHTQYPTGMKVYRISDGTVTYIPELDNLLQYSGSSIRITGKKGIRMITSLTKDNKAALTGKGLAGFTLVEYGTALCWASEIAEGDGLVLGRSFTRSNYAYRKGVADPVFASPGDLVQYTNVLVGFTLDQCRDDIAMRPYIILADAEGNQITLYGGTIYRSIGYIAYQNRAVFKPKTASYNYVWEIIHHVYGDKYDADYKG